MQTHGANAPEGTPSSMPGLTAAWLLALRRMSAHRRTSTAVGAGIVLAAVILAFVPAYSRAMADLGLRFDVQDKAGDSALVTTVSPWLGLGTALPATEERTIGVVNAAAGWFLAQTDTTLTTPTLRAANLAVGEQPAKLTLEAVSDPGSRLDLLEGALPAPGTLEAAIAPNVAEALGIGVGDTVRVLLPLTNCFPPPPPPPGEEPGPADPCNDRVAAGTTLDVPVIGIVAPVEPESRFWAASGADPSEPGQEDWPVYPLLLDYATFRTRLASLSPSTPVTATHTFAADLAALSAGNASAAGGRLDEAADELRTGGVLLISQLDSAFAEFERSTSFSRAPILILAIQVVAVVLVYVAIVAAFVSEELVEETAVLRSRGASVPQVFLLALMEGMTFAVPAILAGPFLAAWLVSFLGATPVFSAETGGEPLSFSLVPESFALAAAGALAATLVLAAPVALSARHRAMESRRAHNRPSGRPFYQRYYLDLAAVLVAAFLLYQLYRQDSVYDSGAFGGLTSDPLLLFAPAILSIAVVAVFLRLFPLLLWVLARVARPFAGPSLDLALTNLARSPGRYARLAVLLTLVVALGAFAATYAPTVDQSYEDRAVYAAGADLRIEGLGRLAGQPIAAVEDALESVPGVAGAAAAWRGAGRLGEDAAADFDVLAVSPGAAASVAAWRDDFADGEPGTLLAQIDTTGAATGLVLPGRPSALALDVQSEDRPALSLWVRLRDADGATYQLLFGKLAGEGWRTYSIEFAENFQFQDEIAYPLTVVSLFFSEPENSPRVDTSPILFDNLRAFEGGRATLVESFEDATRAWTQFSPDPRLEDLATYEAAAGATEGSHVLQYVPASGRSPGKRGIAYNSPRVPVGAIASSRFLATSGMGTGSSFHLRIGDSAIPARIAASVDLFPTLDPGGRGFIVVEAGALFEWDETTGEAPIAPTEAWLDLSEGARPEAVADEVRAGFGAGRIVLAEELARESTANPVVSAGASGLLGAGFVAAFAVLALAVMLSVLLDARRRTVSTAVLRAVGLRPRSVYASLLFEYSLVLLCGAVLGVVLGLRLGDLMLRFLDVTESGAEVVPPFDLETRWDVVSLALVALVVITVASVGAAGVYLRRVAVARAIRLSE